MAEAPSVDRSDAGGHGAVDFHSHLVPGVDDGARTVEDAVEGAERMWRAGVGRIVTTPHLDASLLEDTEAFEARVERVSSAFEKARTAVRDRCPELGFTQGYEVMLDVPGPDLSDPRVRLGESRFVLVEWPRLQLPPGTVEVVSRLRMSGVRPVIAHPERYHGMGAEVELAAEWKRVGGYLQVNYGSFAGRYGPDAKRTAFRLLKRGWVDYLSTDFHGRPNLKLYRREALEKLAELEGAEQAELLTVVNPGRLLDDEEPLPVPPLVLGRGLWGRVRGIFARDRD